MKKLILATLVGSILAGCGGSNKPEPTPPKPVDQINPVDNGKLVRPYGRNDSYNGSDLNLAFKHCSAGSQITRLGKTGLKSGVFKFVTSEQGNGIDGFQLDKYRKGETYLKEAKTTSVDCAHQVLT